MWVQLVSAPLIPAPWLLWPSVDSSLHWDASELRACLSFCRRPLSLGSVRVDTSLLPGWENEWQWVGTHSCHRVYWFQCASHPPSFSWEIFLTCLIPHLCFVVDMGSFCVSQACLEFLDSSNPPASTSQVRVARNVWACHAWLIPHPLVSIFLDGRSPSYPMSRNFSPATVESQVTEERWG